MMKTSFLVACVLLSVSAAPAPEPTKGGSEKSGKLQWAPTDAQVYSTQVGGQQQVIPESSVLRVSDSIAPTVSRTVYSSVAQSPLYVQAPQVVPYATSGRTTVTTTGQPGSLPDGYVWEHQGSSHIGHTSQAVHVKKQSGLAYNVPSYNVQNVQTGYNVPIRGYSVPNPVSGYSVTGYNAYPSYTGYVRDTAYTGYSGIQNIPNVLQAVPAHLTSYALNAAARHGEVRLFNGRHAQFLNNQWYYISPEAAATASGSWNQAWNQGVANFPSLANPTLQTVVLQNGQTVKTYATGAIPRPAIQDNKWYTKTNVRSPATPFYAQAPQYVEVAQSAIKPVVETEERDW